MDKLFFRSQIPEIGLLLTKSMCVTVPGQEEALTLFEQLVVFVPHQETDRMDSSY